MPYFLAYRSTGYVGICYPPAMSKIVDGLFTVGFALFLYLGVGGLILLLLYRVGQALAA